MDTRLTKFCTKLNRLNATSADLNRLSSQSIAFFASVAIEAKKKNIGKRNVILYLLKLYQKIPIPQSVPGLFLYNNFISKKEEKELVYQIDDNQWAAPLKRLVQQYGFSYDYKRRKIEPTNPIPDWLIWLCLRVEAIAKFKPNQVIINNYQSGQGISAHTDLNKFGSIIASISLLSDTDMIFSKGSERERIRLNARSILIMSKEARVTWKHAIPRVSQRRISITFRSY